jgi:hypothetical protein
MIKEVEAKHREKLSTNPAAYTKHDYPGLRKRLIFCSIPVLFMTVALLLHWRIGVIVAVILIAFACTRSEFWSK